MRFFPGINKLPQWEELQVEIIKEFAKLFISGFQDEYLSSLKSPKDEIMEFISNKKTELSLYVYATYAIATYIKVDNHWASIKKLLKTADILGAIELGLEGVAFRYKHMNEILEAFDALKVHFARSTDPNDKYGPIGIGDDKYLRIENPLSYRVMFENLPGATANAQTVVVTDQLDRTKFDLGSFSWAPSALESGR